jgi:nuclear GTP-binding protein
MPKKSKKSKSRRLSLKMKYKQIKKVKEHHRKKRKEAKKLGIKTKGPKDPGIPNSWPFKEELIEQLRAQRERALHREQALRDARRAAQQQQQPSVMDTDNQLGDLQAAAAHRAHSFNNTQHASTHPTATDFIDSSRKAFYKEFTKVVESSDVVIQVLDARDPAGTRCLEVERFIRKVDPSKRIILLLNKIDLVPREVAESWLKYLKEELPAVAFKCSTQKQSTNLGGGGGMSTRSRSKNNSNAANNNDVPEVRGSESAGGDVLLQLIKNYARNAGLKTAITVGVVGLPNIGKSSLINSLKRSKVAQVGNTPGVTKGIQEIHLDKQVRLLDSPGVVFADASTEGEAAAALRNAVKVEKLVDPAAPVREIVRRCPAKQLMQIYKIPKFADADEFMTNVGTTRGKLKKGGAVDVTATARIVLQDWNDGRIPYYTLPPKRKTEIEGSAAVVSAWGKEFDPEALLASQQVVVQSLPSLADASGNGIGDGTGLSNAFQMKTLGAVEVGLEEMEHDDDDDDDIFDTMDEGEAGAGGKGITTKSGAAKQNETLYAEEGQFNPHSARADKKRRKKSIPGGGAGTGAHEGDDNDGEYVFDEALWSSGGGGGNGFEVLGEEEDSSDGDGDEMME